MTYNYLCIVAMNSAEGFLTGDPRNLPLLSLDRLEEVGSHRESVFVGMFL